MDVKLEYYLIPVADRNRRKKKRNPSSRERKESKKILEGIGIRDKDGISRV